MKTILLAAALAGLAPTAWAVNKCTGPDGKVSYQADPCPTSAKSDQLRIAASGGASSGSGWRFERRADELTGKVSCFAFSNITTPKIVPGNREFNFKPVHMLALVMNGNVSIGVRTSDDKTLFHTDTSGVGFKTDAGAFTTLSRPSSAHVLLADSTEALRDEFSRARQVTLRLRFWPYDTLIDMDPIPMNGFTQALAQAKACSGG